MDWWDGMLSLLQDLLDPKDPRPKDFLGLFVIVLIILVMLFYWAPISLFSWR